MGIDEFGNFLNGTNLVPGYTGTNNATGDNSAYGYGYKPGRIGLRGAGSISWAALNGAYGTDPNNAAKPYYPASLATTYSNYNYSCPTGTTQYKDAGGTPISCYACPGNQYTNYPPAPSGGGSYGFDGVNCTYLKNGTTYTHAPLSLSPVTATPTGNSLAVQAVKQACSTGHLYNYKTATTTAAASDAGTATLSNTVNTAGILDYAPIPGAYKELTGFTIANESAVTRADGTAIFYNLKVTQNGLLSLSYSTGGAYSYIIKDQSITASNGDLPSTFRFGFAGSTGGNSNIHEIMCFKAASANTSGSSATVNEKQAAKVEAGTQAYFAFYNPNDWTGSLTANDLIDTAGVVSVRTIANWDAQCLLTGTSGTVAAGGGCISTGVNGPTSATPVSGNRIMMTWDTVNNVGIPFRWTSLNNAQKAVLGDENNTADSDTIAQTRLNYLRGDTTNEITSAGTGRYRSRAGILGDIVDSSPSWVGPPSSPYTASWKDRLNPTNSMAENSGTQSYLQFVTAVQSRLNVVYTGANDGFLHGFRAGSFDANGVFCGVTGSTLANCSSTPNDGQEVLAYMPGSLLVSAALPKKTGGCTDVTSTGTVVQNIHGWTPAISTTVGTVTTTNNQCETPELDFSAAQYGHNFFVDATPGTGDLFYGGTWHTWLVGGLGVGGAAVYALDVTNPSSSAYTEGNASNIVIGEWNATSISCTNVTNCGVNLGNTFGTPQIRRLHNGTWAVIFGNGFGSTSGDAGIYILTIANNGTKTFYYLSTGTGTGTAANPCTANCDGIAYTTPADLDGDHITDYVYAGDLKGNVWRFDLHDTNPANWTAAGAPLFTTPSGQPITTQLLVLSSVSVGNQPRLMIEFGTGQRTQITNLAPAGYISGKQALYGIWDWNMSGWNALAAGSQYASLTAAGTGLSSPYTIPACPATGACSSLTAQTLSAPNANGVVDGTNVTVCWQGTTACPSGNSSFGWYATLPSTSEQIIFNPVFYNGGILVNSTVPATNSATSCTINTDTGYTYALSITNGGVFANAFPKYTNNGTLVTDSIEAGIQTNATGSVYVVTTAEGTSNIVYQTVSGTPGAQQVNIPANTKAKRLTWIERR